MSTSDVTGNLEDSSFQISLKVTILRRERDAKSPCSPDVTAYTSKKCHNGCLERIMFFPVLGCRFDGIFSKNHSLSENCNFFDDACPNGYGGSTADSDIANAPRSQSWEPFAVKYNVCPALFKNLMLQCCITNNTSLIGRITILNPSKGQVCITGRLLLHLAFCYKF